jgi:hypothetical protein
LGRGRGGWEKRIQRQGGKCRGKETNGIDRRKWMGGIERKQTRGMDVLYSVETTYGINSVISKLMTFVKNAETGRFLFLMVLILSCFTYS